MHSSGISKLFGTRANIWSAMLRRAKAFKHGKTQCTNIAFIICFARLKKYGTVQVEHGNIFETTEEKSAHLMNAVNVKDGAAYSSTTDRTVGRAERLRVAEDPSNVCP